MKYISKTVYHKVGMRKMGYPEAGIKWVLNIPLIIFAKIYQGRR